MSLFRNTFVGKLIKKKINFSNNLKEEKKLKTLKKNKPKIQHLIELKVNFFIPLWGEEYVENFIKYSLKSFLSDDNISSFKLISRNSKFVIWTRNKDKIFIEQNENIKILNQHITIEYINIDEIIKQLDNITKSKYEFLSVLQNLFISTCVDIDYIFFIYPDFLFTKNSLLSCIQKLNKNLDAIFCPVPQLISELTKNSINKDGFDKFINKLPQNAIKFKHDIITRCIVNEGNILTTPSLFVYNYKNDCLLFRNFHLHPLLIKVQRNNPNFFKPFFPSLDEEFVKLFTHNKNYYIPKNSDEMLFVSLAGKNEIDLNPLIGDDYTISLWAEQFTNEVHRNFINHEYFIKGKNLVETEYKYIQKNISIFINPIMKILNLGSKELEKKYPNHYNGRLMRKNKPNFNHELLERNTEIMNEYLKNFTKINQKGKKQFFLDKINELKTSPIYRKILLSIHTY